MLESPQVISTHARQAAVIPLKIPREDMAKVFGPAIDEIVSALKKQGIDPIGPAFAHHVAMSPTHFDFEVGLPVSKPIEPSGRIVSGELPACPRVAHTTYVGPYEGLGDAWGEFEAWMSEQGFTPQENLWESYTEGPHTDSDPLNWRTELYRPLEEQDEQSPAP